MPPSVAVIGAGVSGIACARACLPYGLDVTVFDRRRSIGGMWSLAESTPVYDRLTTNTSVYSTAFSDVPLGLHETHREGLTPGYDDLCLTAREFRDYLQRVVRDTPGLARVLRLGRVVRSVRPASSHESGDGYIVCHVAVSTEKEGSQTEGEQVREAFDHVVVASGYFDTPALPDDATFPGLSTFGGTVWHSAEYRSPAQCAGLRVLVVGGGVSGAEIVADLVQAQGDKPASVALCMRDRRRLVEKQNTQAVLSDAIATRLRALQKRAGLTGTPQFRRGFGKINRDFRFEPITDIERQGKSLVVTPVHGALMDACAAGEVARHYGGVMRVGGDEQNRKTVTFGDGTSGEFDVIFFAIGYRLQLDFLGEDVRQTLHMPNLPGRMLNLFNYTTHPNFPNLSFVGLFPPVGSFALMVENQARWAARMIAHPDTRPSKESIWAGIKHFAQVCTPRVMTYEVADEFAREAGFEVDLGMQKEWTKALLLAPLTPTQYRLLGKMNESTRTAAKQEHQQEREQLAEEFERQMNGIGFTKGDNTVEVDTLKELKWTWEELTAKGMAHQGLEQAVRYLFEVNNVPFD